MRRTAMGAIAAVVCLVSARAAAHPATPPLEKNWLDDVSFEAAAHVGLAAVEVSYPETAQGTVPFFDGEVGVRVAPRLTIAAFGDYLRFHDRANTPGGQFDDDSRFYDLGARLHYHVGIAFFGLAIGYENQRNVWAGAPPLVSMSTTLTGAIYELHGGLTAPLGNHVGIQLLAIGSYSSDSTHSLRAAIGVQFR